MKSSTRNELFIYYKVRRTTELVDEDLKTLKKINTLINKYLQYEKDSYFDEAINTLKIISNLFTVNKKFMKLFKDEFIDTKNVRIFNQIARESGVIYG